MPMYQIGSGFYPMLSFEQANPYLEALNYNAQIQTNQAKAQQEQTIAQYMPQTMAEQLKQMQSKSEIDAATANYADPMEYAKLLQAQVAPDLTKAQTQEEQAKAYYESMMGKQAAALLPTDVVKAQFLARNPILNLGLSGGAQNIALLSAASGNPQDFPGLANQPATIQPNQYGQLAAAANAISPGSATFDGRQITPAPGQMVSQMPTLPIANNPLAQQAMQKHQGGMPQNNVLPSMGVNNGMSPMDMLKAQIMAPLQAQMAKTNYLNTMNQGYGYRTTTPTEKNYMQAQAAGMGYDPLTSSTLFSKGYTLADLAEQKGLGRDPQNWPDPIYALTPKGVAQVQQRQQANAEINALNPTLTAALAPYSQRIAGWSPKQIADGLNGTDPDAQAKFLAARALQPELAGMRFRAMSGTTLGVEAMEKIMDSSMGNIKNLQALVDPKVYTKAQQYLDQWITQGVNAADSSNANAMKRINSMPNMQQGQQGMSYTDDDVTATANAMKISEDEARRRIEAKGYIPAGSKGNKDLYNKMDQLSQNLDENSALQGGQESGG